MTSYEPLENLKAYLDGELAPEDAAMVREALENDPELRNTANSFEAIAASLKRIASPAPVGFERLGQINTRRRLIQRLAIGIVAASVVLAAIFIPTLFKRSMRDTATMPAIEVTAPPLGGWGAPSEAQAPSDSKASSRPKVEGGSDAESGRDFSMPSTGALNREVIRTASLTIRVVNIDEAEQQVKDWVAGWGGYVGDSSSSDLDRANPTLTMSVRIPVEHFESAIEQFESLGVRTHKLTSSDDVTAQLIDIDARMRNLRVQEETYRQILRKTTKVGEVLDVQQRLTEIRSEIESMEAQQKGLQQLADLCTITLTLRQRPSDAADAEDPGWAGDAWASATRALVTAFRAVGVALIWFFVYAPIWLPLAFLAWLAIRATGRRPR